jgi:hypothetical protein
VDGGGSGRSFGRRSRSRTTCVQRRAIEHVRARRLHLSQPSYQALKRILKHYTAQEASAAADTPLSALTVVIGARSGGSNRTSSPHAPSLSLYPSDK